MRLYCSIRQCASFIMTGLITITVYLIFHSYSPRDHFRFNLDVSENFRNVPKKTKCEFKTPQRRVYSVSCSEVIEGDATEITKAKKVMKTLSKTPIKDVDFINITSDCDVFLDKFGYQRYIISNIERNFPIAYSILVYESVEQMAHLLRAIYRPQNVYCIHIDTSANDVFKKAMTSLVRCLRNVFLVSQPVDVIYSHFSRLEADLNCMTDLLRHDIRWNYVINLPSTEYPLKTNLEIVKILRIYNGSNDIEGITTPGRMLQNRFRHSYKLQGQNIQQTTVKKVSPPHNITVVKGSAYGVFSRKFVEFVMNDKRANDFLNWTKDILSPDEYFWATLNHNPHLGVPGQYKGKPDNKPWLAAYASWAGRDRCHGIHRHGICVFGVEDLEELVSRKELFANKFYTSYQHLTLDCLEEWLINKTFSDVPFDTFYYSQLPFIKK